MNSKTATANRLPACAPAKGRKTPESMDAAVARIAAEILEIETLETRRMDGLDFHDCAVWGLKAALEAAFKAGAASVK